MAWLDGEFKFKTPECKFKTPEFEVKIQSFKIKIPEKQVKIPARDIKINKHEAAAAVAGGAIGANFGSSVGIAAFGTAVSGTVPFGIAGFALGVRLARAKAKRTASNSDDENSSANDLLKRINF